MTHQIKISERESEAFPLSSWRCSPQHNPLLCALLPALGSALLHPRAACGEPRSLPSQLTALLRVFWEPESVEKTVPSKLQCKWSLRVSSGWGRSSGVEADVWFLVGLAWKPWLGNRGPLGLGSQPVPFPTSGAQGCPARCPERGC